MPTDTRTTSSFTTSRADFYDDYGTGTFVPDAHYIDGDYGYGPDIGYSKTITSTRGPKPRKDVLTINPVHIRTEIGTSAAKYETITSGSPTWPGRTFKSTGDVCNHAEFKNAIMPISCPGWLSSWAVQKAWAKTAQAELDVGASIVELSETINMLRNPISAMAKYLKKPRNIRHLRDHSNMAVGTWLEARYGWRPLFMDISNYISFLRSEPKAFSEKLRRTTGVTVQESSGWYKGTLNWVSNNLYRQENIWKQNIKYKCSAHVYFKMDAPLTWQQRFGVDWSSIPSLVWEKIPLSFCVDWFFNVGLWLNAHRHLDQRHLLGSCLTTTVSSSTTGIVTRAYPSSYDCTPAVTKPGCFYHTVNDMVRVKDPTLSALPTVNKSIHSILHGLDAISLIYQRIPFGKFKRS